MPTPICKSGRAPWRSGLLESSLGRQAGDLGWMDGWGEVGWEELAQAGLLDVAGAWGLD